jgi:phosphoserine phosphatase
MKKKYWQPMNLVVFDCDSTIVSIEGIDELARLNGQYNEIEKLTSKAMNGSVSFEQVFELRLKKINPSIQDLFRVGELYISNITPGTE